MISIIICARQADITPGLRKNIETTIGVDHEIIVIDNSQNQHTIFSAYNKGVQLSRFPLLLFMHDDIEYRTDNWGPKLIEHFKDEKIGAVGIAGTHYMAYTTGAWWSSGVGHLHLLQSTKEDPEPKMQNYLPKNLSAGDEVLVLDGVWFCIRRKLFDAIRFDENTFHGFHFYDVDTTLQVREQGYTLKCIRDILIHHLSMGVLNKTWVDNAFLFHQKWKHQLPLSLVNYSLAEQCEMEYRVINEFIYTQIDCGYQKKSRIYFSAVKALFSFKKNYRYIKTPVWASRLLFHAVKHSILNQ